MRVEGYIDMKCIQCGIHRNFQSQTIPSIYCDVCRTMVAAVAAREWFRAAHQEYLEEIASAKLRKRMLLGGPDSGTDSGLETD